MKDYAAYLFDLDGTLVDSEKLKGKALVATCEKFGGKAPINAYKQVMGESWKYVANHFFKVAGIKPKMELFNEEFKKIYKELLFGELKPNLNSVAFLTKLKKKGKRIGLVSSASLWMVDQILTQLKLSRFFDIVIVKEDVIKHKPDPEAYLLALEKLSLDSDNVLIFEDSYPGLIAAQSANCDVIAFKHAFNKGHNFKSAIQVIEDFDEILI